MMRWRQAGLVALMGLAMASPLAGQQRIALEVSGAELSSDSMGNPAVSVLLTPAGQNVFARISADNVGHVVDLLVDGQVVTSPVVQTVINSPSLMLSGAFSLQEASDLAARITHSGAVVEVVVPAPRKTKAKS